MVKKYLKTIAVDFFSVRAHVGLIDVSLVFRIALTHSGINKC